MAIIQKPE
ncbi:1eec9c76-d998-4789-8a01-b69bb253fb16 [Thermothielavioides terrestris]|uniref:1eec9c76-d998-4789-8a01-b69bb253fb16 n=1 Tax=Thermothielavioides terrestris TaxID=2587410 RepID=A0A3S4BJT1_9PEZI|nr:1eec9c76-d998-4789-8a01-b69bb253fb16 [Thermothielavioides terrestris]